MDTLSIADICMDDEGTIYLVDPMASYVFVFDKEGKYVRSGQPGAVLNIPFGVAVDSAKRGVIFLDSRLRGNDERSLLSIFIYVVGLKSYEYWLRKLFRILSRKWKRA